MMARLMAGGDFTRAGDHASAYFAKWGPDWQPIAEAGDDQIVYTIDDEDGRELMFDGSESNDPYGAICLRTVDVDRRWQYMRGKRSKPVIRLPVGTHTVHLTVNDGLADSAADYVNVMVVGPLMGTLKITPNTINYKSQQPNIDAAIALPAGIKGSDVDEAFGLTIYPGEIKAHKQTIRPASSEISLAFDKDAVCRASGIGEVELKVAGKLKSGQWFYGADKVKITH